MITKWIRAFSWLPKFLEELMYYKPWQEAVICCLTFDLVYVVLLLVKISDLKLLQKVLSAHPPNTCLSQGFSALIWHSMNSSIHLMSQWLLNAKRHRNAKWGLVMKCPMLRMWLTARENREGDFGTSCWRSWRRHSKLSLSMSQYIYFCFWTPDTLPLRLSVSIKHECILCFLQSDCACVRESVVCRRILSIIINLWNTETVCLSRNVVWINPLKSHCGFVTFLAGCISWNHNETINLHENHQEMSNYWNHIWWFFWNAFEMF